MDEGDQANTGAGADPTPAKTSRKADNDPVTQTTEYKLAQAAASEAKPLDKDSLVRKFLEKSGYPPEFVLHSDAARRTVVTSNGGKYAVSSKGNIRTLKGPDYPNFIPGE